MPFKILYHHKIKGDLNHIDPLTKKKIIKTIEGRLSVNPEKYGKPLRKPMKRYWKLRMGKYRVVYKIARNEVLLLAILPRNKVYEIMKKRED
jgi:mRNA interferase RelE/StbE